MMKKKKLTETLGDERYFDAEYNSVVIPISDLRGMISDFADIGTTHVEVKTSGFDGDIDSFNFQPLIIKEESDIEYEIRMNEESAREYVRQQKIKQAELKEYERLKAKFG